MLYQKQWTAMATLNSTLANQHYPAQGVHNGLNFPPNHPVPLYHSPFQQVIHPQAFTMPPHSGLYHTSGIPLTINPMQTNPMHMVLQPNCWGIQGTQHIIPQNISAQRVGVPHTIPLYIPAHGLCHTPNGVPPRSTFPVGPRQNHGVMGSVQGQTIHGRGTDSFQGQSLVKNRHGQNDQVRTNVVDLTKENQPLRENIQLHKRCIPEEEGSSESQASLVREKTDNQKIIPVVDLRKIRLDWNSSLKLRYTQLKRWKVPDLQQLQKKTWGKTCRLPPLRQRRVKTTPNQIRTLQSVF